MTGSGEPVSVAAGVRFGEAPLPQTKAAAAALRRLADLVLRLEHPHPALEALLQQVADADVALAAAVPPDDSPRLGGDDSARHRVYLDHAFDVGAFNPAFPEYRFDHLDAETATGTVNFPLVYEGPPGLVHGGFLAVFFDCVTQHQSCAAGLAGKTRSLHVRYRRPTPVLTDLRFDIVRAEVERGIQLTGRLLLGDDVLCLCEVGTVATAPQNLSAFQLGTRRATP